jgi:hypothetical protein
MKNIQRKNNCKVRYVIYSRDDRRRGRIQYAGDLLFADFMVVVVLPERGERQGFGGVCRAFQ